MKSFVLIFSLATVIAYPTPDPNPDDRVFFPDEIDDSSDDLRNYNQLRLLTDSHILKSDNASEKFVKDDSALQDLESGQFYQGDILLVQDQVDYLKLTLDKNNKFPSRTGVISESYRWPRSSAFGDKVIVPFTISNEYSYLDIIKIYLAMYDIEKYTCVEFKTRRNNEADYINIKNGAGCSSHLGRIGGKQDVTLKMKGCMSRGTIIHELIHALGYDHMHSDADRDKYVSIVWGNVESKNRHNFEKVDKRKFSNFGTPYDFYSVMHYNPTAFSKNGKRTIVPREDRYRNVIGQRVGMSEGDAKRINNMYNCDI